MSTEGLPTVTEAEASGHIADVFADIRDTMGIAVVNLIWRRLATSTPALDWCWNRLKPAYASGAIPAAAWTLRQRIEHPSLRPLDQAELEALGVDGPTLETISAVLRTYERGNAQNLIAMCCLRWGVAGLSPSPEDLGPPLATQDRSAEVADRADVPLAAIA